MQTAAVCSLRGPRRVQARRAVVGRGEAGSPPSPQKISPANIGGGGRVERDFYGEWLKKSGVPQIEGYAIADASTQELKPWPEIGGRGLYCHFSGNVHMDAVIMEIPPGKALNPGKHMYEQLIYVLERPRIHARRAGRQVQQRAMGRGQPVCPAAERASIATTTTIRPSRRACLRSRRSR